MLSQLRPLASAENMEWATRIYQKLMRFAPDLLSIKESAKFEVEGYFTLISLEVTDASEGYRRISLNHCWSDDSGTLISDPDIEIAVYPDWEMAEALIYRDTFSVEVAYPVEGGPVDTKAYLSINNSLERWLDSLLQQENVQRMGAI